MNLFVGTGNLGADPQLRHTSSGRAVCNFNVAIDRRYSAGQGDDRRVVKQTDWIPVVVWGVQAENCARYLQKGSKVGLTGRVQPRQYADQNGITHNTFEVVADNVEFLGRIRSTEEAQTVALDTESADV